MRSNGDGAFKSIDAIEIAHMLMHIVAPEEQSPGYLALRAEGEHLAARIHQFVGIVRQQVEVQSILRKLCNVEVSSGQP